MIISINAEKDFDRIQHPFMIKKKTPQKVDTEGKLLKGKNWKDFLQDQEQDKDTHIHHFYSTVLEVLATAIREEIKEIQIRKEIKLSVFPDDMILYIENPKDATRKILELILMTVVKLKDTKSIYRNLLLSHRLTMKCQKGKLRKQCHSPLHQKENAEG